MSSDILGGTNSGLLQPYLHGLVYQIAAPADDSEEPTELHITAPETVLDEAARITSGDRQDDYGHPSANHACTAAMWSAYLGVPVTARDVCWMNVLQKASRDRHKPKRDNLTDGCGFLRNAEMLET